MNGTELYSQPCNATCNGSMTHHRLIATDQEEGNPVVILALLCVCTWITVANLFVALFFLCNKQRMKNIYSTTQILSLSVTDLQVGISSVIVTMSYYHKGTFLNYNACAIVFFYYLASQFASFYHTFAICLHRFITIFNKLEASAQRTVSRSVSRYKVLVHIIVIWLIATVLAAFTFSLNAAFGDTVLPVCSLPTLFGQRYERWLTMACVFLLTPQIVISVMYVMFCVKLSKRLRTIATQRMTRTHTETRTCSTLLSDYLFCNCKRKLIRLNNGLRTAHTTNGNFMNDRNCHDAIMSPSSSQKPSTSWASNESDNATQKKVIATKTLACLLTGQQRYIQGNAGVTNDHRNINSLNVFSLTNQQETHVPFRTKCNKSICSNQTNIRSTNTRCQGHACTQATCNPQTDQLAQRQVSYATRQRLANNRSVMITIGLLLLVINICMTPLNLLFVIEKITHDQLTRAAKFIILTMSLLNSAINPFIYAFRIRQLREACVSILRRPCRWHSS